MKIQFTKDFRGKETKEAFYKSGAVVEIYNDEHAKRLISLGFAVEVKDAEPVKVKAKK